MTAPFARIVDLRSDTVTRPVPGMREAIARAEVGDHVLGDDPTAAELERYAAELLGKEGALFFPSGSMANTAAVLLQARPGTQALIDVGGHILHYEEGAAAALGGVQLRPLDSRDGLPAPESVLAAAGSSRYNPVVSLLCLENTHNSAGGRVFPPARVREVAEAARTHRLAVHLDGARLPNAAVASGLPMRAWSDLADTVMISLSKGLGAPVGSILAGPAALMEEGWRLRRRLGGAMRQTGILAAAGLFALRNHLGRLADDHRRAADLARAVDALPGFRASEPDTNIVMIELDDDAGPVAEVHGALEAAGVRLVPFGPRRLRAVTHLDVDDAGIRRAADTFSALSQRRLERAG